MVGAAGHGEGIYPVCTPVNNKRISFLYTLGYDRAVTESEIKTLAAARLRKAREDKGLSQAGLGSVVGLNGTSARQVIAKYEGGDPPAAWVRLRRICEELDVDPSWVLGLEEDS